MRPICIVRDIYTALTVFEKCFEEVHGVSVNEAITLCTLAEGRLTAGEIAEKTGMMLSHNSKVIRLIEKKGLIERNLGDRDKRQMYFRLTVTGEQCLAGMECGTVEIPGILKPIFEQRCGKM